MKFIIRPCLIFIAFIILPLRGDAVSLRLLWSEGAVTISENDEVIRVMSKMCDSINDLRQEHAKLFELLDIEKGKQSVSIFSIYRLHIDGNDYYVSQILPGEWKSNDLGAAISEFSKTVVRKIKEKGWEVKGTFIDGSLGCIPVIFRVSGEDLLFEKVKINSLEQGFSRFFRFAVPPDIESLTRLELLFSNGKEK